jgi:hypothetical protein
MASLVKDVASKLKGKGNDEEESSKKSPAADKDGKEAKGDAKVDEKGNPIKVPIYHIGLLCYCP